MTNTQKSKQNKTKQNQTAFFCFQVEKYIETDYSIYLFTFLKETI